MNSDVRSFQHYRSEEWKEFNPIFNGYIAPELCCGAAAKSTSSAAGGHCCEASRKLILSNGKIDCIYEESASDKLTELGPPTPPRPTALQGNSDARRDLSCACKASHQGKDACSCEAAGTGVLTEGTLDVTTQQCASLADSATDTELFSSQAGGRNSQARALKEHEQQLDATQYLLEGMSDDCSSREALDGSSKHPEAEHRAGSHIKQLHVLKGLPPNEKCLCVEQRTRDITSAHGVTKAIPITATKLAIAEVIPGLKLQLSVGQEASDVKPKNHSLNDVSLELKIGPQDAGRKEGAYGTGLFRPEMPTKRRSGFSKWQRPCTKDVGGATAECLGVPRWPIKPDNTGLAKEADVFLESVRPEMRTPQCPLQGTALASVISEVGIPMIQVGSFNGNLGMSTAQRGFPYATVGVPFGSPTATLGVFMSQGVRHTTIGVPLTRFGTQTGPAMPTTIPSIASLSNMEKSTVNMLQTAFPSVAWAQIGGPNSPENISVRNVEPPENSFSIKIGVPQNSVKADMENNPTMLESGMEVEDSGMTMMHLDDVKDPKGCVAELDPLKYRGLVKMPIEIPSIQDATLVEFLRAKKLQKDHFLDKIVVSADVYQKHPWHYTGGDIRGFSYFCCNTKYSMRGNMTRDRMTREGGRWKQQGMVHPILNVKEHDAALKTYMSYIPCGKNTLKGDFVPNTPGRVKHRHRMIEIALEEDLKLEKLFFKFKVAPKPFLVVCVLKKA